MILIETASDFKKLDNGNSILGSPKLNNSKIKFHGKNNILYCEKGVKFDNSCLEFKGSNSLIYLGSNINTYSLDVAIYNDQVFHMGENNYINGKLKVILSEQKHIYIGSNCLFSTEIVFRNADPHLIYDGDTGERINPTKSIFIGEHVWIGQRSIILKGTQIDSGSIVGAMSLVAGKKIPHNSSWAGNPAKQIKSNIFWYDSSVHAWVKDKTDISMNWGTYKESKNITEEYLYHYDINNSISFDEMDKQISDCKSSKDKLDYFLNFDKIHNQFAHIKD